MSDYNYLTFPVSLLNFSSDNKKVTHQRISEIIDEAVLYLFQWKTFDEKEAAKQVYYNLLRHPDDLGLELKGYLETMTENEELTLSDPADLFIDNEFLPEEDLDPILDKMKTSEKFNELCTQFYYKNLAHQILGIYYNYFATVWKLIQERANLLDKGPIVSIKTTWVFDARDGKIPLELFRMVCAVRSIVGKKKYAYTNRQMIVSRMYGLRSPKKYESLTQNLKEEYDYLIKRYPFDKLMGRATNRGFLAKISAGRGYYVSKNPNIKQLEESVHQSLERKRHKKEIEKNAADRIKANRKKI